MAKSALQKKSASNDSGLNLVAQFWAVADKMRGHMDASEYMHICLGLIFLNYNSDAYEEKRDQLLFGFSDPKGEWFTKEELQRDEATENRDEYLAVNVFRLQPKQHSGSVGDNLVDKQESNYTTWKLTRINRHRVSTCHKA